MSKAWFVSVTGTYLSNGQVFHAYEGIVIAADDEAAINAAINNTSLNQTSKVFEGLTRSGDYDLLPVYRNPDSLDAELILDDIFADELTNHILNGIVVDGLNSTFSKDHPAVANVAQAIDQMAATLAFK